MLPRNKRVGVCKLKKKRSKPPLLKLEGLVWQARRAAPWLLRECESALCVRWYVVAAVCVWVIFGWQCGGGGSTVSQVERARAAAAAAAPCCRSLPFLKQKTTVSPLYTQTHTHTHKKRGAGPVGLY